MTSFATIIYCLLALGLGVFVGAAWGLSRHVEPPKKEDLTQSPESDKIVPSLDAQLAEKEIGVLCREELVDDFFLMEQICLEYADKLKEAAEEPDGFLFKALADQIRDELLQRSEHTLKYVVVDISWEYVYDSKYIQVKFDLDFDLAKNNLG